MRLGPGHQRQQSGKEEQACIHDKPTHMMSSRVRKRGEQDGPGRPDIERRSESHRRPFNLRESPQCALLGNRFGKAAHDTVSPARREADARLPPRGFDELVPSRPGSLDPSPQHSLRVRV